MLDRRTRGRVRRKTAEPVHGAVYIASVMTESYSTIFFPNTRQLANRCNTFKHEIYFSCIPYRGDALPSLPRQSLVHPALHASWANTKKLAPTLLYAATVLVHYWFLVHRRSNAFVPSSVASVCAVCRLQLFVCWSKCLYVNSNSIISNRKSTMVFPTSYRSSVSVTPKSSKEWLKNEFSVFRYKI